MCLSESIPTIDPSKLPELPPLPPALATSVFTHKSTNYLRNELMGDAVICLWVTNWITEQHDSIGAHTATMVRSMMVSNATLGMLSRHYKLHERVLFGSSLAWPETSKKHADLFEAYIGAIWRASSQDLVPVDTLQRYFHTLFTCGAFPDLEDRIKALKIAKNQKQSGQPAPVGSARKRKRDEIMGDARSVEGGSVGAGPAYEDDKHPQSSGSDPKSGDTDTKDGVPPFESKQDTFEGSIHMAYHFLILQKFKAAKSRFAE